MIRMGNDLMAFRHFLVDGNVEVEIAAKWTSIRLPRETNIYGCLAF
jgi:hypothetical protein